MNIDANKLPIEKNGKMRRYTPGSIRIANVTLKISHDEGDLWNFTIKWW
jgi:hypothetical protein